MDNPLVSVVIPCYNQAHWLPTAVESCLAQTYPHIEVIVVDDGSSDDVRGSLTRFGNRVQLIEQPNQGLSGARNSGLRVANGQFIKFLDADDWLLPPCIELQVKALQNLNNYIALIGYRRFFEESPWGNEDLYPDFGNFRQALCKVNISPPHTFLFPVASLKERGGYGTDPILFGHEDYDLHCRLAADGFEAVAVHAIGCVYRERPGSMGKQTEGMRISRLTIWRAYADRLIQGHCSVETAVHLFAGYVFLILMDQVRYQAGDTLEMISRHILAEQSELTRSSALTLCYELEYLLRYLPYPLSPQESRARLKGLAIIQRLIDAATTQLLSHPGYLDPVFQCLIQVVEAQMFAGQTREAKKILKKIRPIMPAHFKPKFSIKCLELPSILLPGRPISALFRGILSGYGNKVPRRFFFGREIW